MLFGEGDLSGVGNSNFSAAGWDSSSIYRLSPKLYVWAKGRAVHMHGPYGRGNKQGGNRRNIFSKMENAGGIIQGDNSPRHCFVLRDSIPMKFFK